VSQLHIAAILSTALAALAVAGCTPAASRTDVATAASAPAAPVPGAALADFFRKYDEAQLSLSPQDKAYRGISDDDYGRWNDVGDEAEVARHMLQQASAAALRDSFDPAALSEDEALSVELFLAQAARGDRLFRFRRLGYVFDQMSGAHSRLPAFLINIHRVSDVAEAEAYVARIRALGPLIDALSAEAAERAAAGVQPPRWAYAYVISDIENLRRPEVARIHGEMEKIRDKVGFRGDLKQFFEHLRTSPQYYHTTREDYLAEVDTHVKAMEARLPAFFNTLPKAGLHVKAVEAFREKSAGKAFYQSPSPDGSRPGTYYVNLYDLRDMPITELEALAYHESVPGHHLQRAVQTELTGLPPFRRFGSFTAYTEGWGLYAEELARDMGFYTDPYSDFGRLAMELWRACRLVVDTGIHDRKWSRERAIAYLKDNTPNPDGDIEKAIERYIVFPGQATAYLIGKMKIVELRTRAQTALGERFDIRAFHDVVLQSGPVPLDILEKRVDAWIARAER